MTALLWDQHTCLPLDTDADIGPLTRYQYAGGTVLSVNADIHHMASATPWPSCTTFVP